MNIHSVEQLSRDDDTNSVDGEGVWAPDIESAFHEGLKLFPPCGRRKHILQEEGGGKMYGRNELIARHILMRTGKIRTRKQVSSHIQVLNRRKHKTDNQSTSASTSSDTPSPSSGFSFLDSTSSVSNNHHHVNPFNRQNNQPAHATTLPDRTSYNDHINQMQTTTMTSNGLVTQHAYHLNHHHHHHHHHNSTNESHLSDFHDFWNDGPIVTQKIKLVEFSAFVEYSSFPNQTALARPNSSLISPLLGAVTIDDQQPTRQTNTNVHHHHHLNTVYSVIHNNNLPTQLNTTSNNIYDANSYDRLSSSLISNTNGLGPFSNPNNGLHQQERSDSHPFNINQNQLFNGLQAEANQTSNGSGIKRHTYVKIDYSQSIGRQANKLERIDITQIQDKFPEICDLFLRSSPYSFYLVKFWADINSDYEYNIEDQNTNFGISSHFETVERYEDITVSTKACSYGCQVVEKVDKIYSTFDSSKQRYSYKINNSPMCEFMIRFIKKLRQLPETSQMNSVLENFTVLQVITTDSTPEILMCLAYVFEVASAEHNGTQYHVYRLSKD